MKLFKKTKEEELVKSPTLVKETWIQSDKKINPLDKYNRLQKQFSISPTEEIRLEMVALSEQMNKDAPKPSKFEKLRFKPGFKRKRQTMKNVEAYCPECKHLIQKHCKGNRSSGCSKCGCLADIKTILAANKINPADLKMKVSSEVELFCTCEHKQSMHVQGELFCEIEQCKCTEFKDKKKERGAV